MLNRFPSSKKLVGVDIVRSKKDNGFFTPRFPNDPRDVFYRCRGGADTYIVRKG